VAQQRLINLAYRKTICAVVALSIVLAVGGRAAAIDLYATSIAGSQIDKVDTVTNSVSTYLSTPSAADSIMFDTTQRVIYTAINTGEVRRYDPTGPSDTALTGGLSSPADMVLEPGGNTMLVSEFGGGRIDRVNLTTNTVTTLLTPGGTPEGLAYDGARLFANLGSRFGGPTGKFVAEINPVNGNILATSPGLDSLDGLTFDPYSGRLFASSLFSNQVLSINPNNLNDVQVVSDAFGKPLTIPAPDGITTDGVGNIYVASSASLGDSHIYQIDLVNSVLTQKAFVFGLDDLAPATGAGSIPEPSTFVLGIAGLTSFGFVTLRKKFRRA
jgi:sugar lactone lactonase YvrE